jgi:RimJ/RimL family protein N-acetyltransferase
MFLWRMFKKKRFSMQPTLLTSRLVLRPFDLEDAKQVQSLAGEFAIAENMPYLPHPYHDGIAEEWIKSLAPNFSQGLEATFAITLRETNELIGAISLMHVIRDHQAELGYWIGTHYWRQGYATEAARRMVEYAFKDRGLQRIHARHTARNPNSGKIMRGLGMQHEGTRLRHVYKWGRFDDVELYGLLKEDWVKHNARKPKHPS